MPIRLYHRTTREGSIAIPQEGFRDGEDGGVWLSKLLDAWGEQGRHLIEVLIDLTEAELSHFAHEVVADEVWNDEIGDFVTVEDSGFVERFVWFEIPAALVNARSTVRLVPPDEARRIEVNGERAGED